MSLEIYLMRHIFSYLCLSYGNLEAIWSTAPQQCLSSPSFNITYQSFTESSQMSDGIMQDERLSRYT
jgi:hypothetical protein